MYETFYQLKDRPFRSGYEEAYFCVTGPVERLVGQILDDLEQEQKSILAVTGPTGIGKTALAHFLSRHVLEEENTALLEADEPRDDVDFLAQLLTKLRVDATGHDYKSLFHALHQKAVQKVKNQQRLNLVIDDAHRLSAYRLQVIAYLASLRYKEHKLFNLILIGAPELVELLRNDEENGLSERVGTPRTLGPLDAQSCKKYILHRLKVAGWQGDPVLDDEVFAAIHAHAHGIPAEINRVCEKLLVLGMLRQSHHLTRADVATLFDIAGESRQKATSSPPYQSEPPELPEPSSRDAPPSPPHSAATPDILGEEELAWLDGAPRAKRAKKATPRQGGRRWALAAVTLFSLTAALLGYNREALQTLLEHGLSSNVAAQQTHAREDLAEHHPRRGEEQTHDGQEGHARTVERYVLQGFEAGDPLYDGETMDMRRLFIRPVGDRPSLDREVDASDESMDGARAALAPQTPATAHHGDNHDAHPEGNDTHSPTTAMNEHLDNPPGLTADSHPSRHTAHSSHE